VGASSDSGEISLSVLCGVESKRVELHPSRILSHIRGFALARRSITLLIHRTTATAHYCLGYFSRRL